MEIKKLTPFKLWVLQNFPFIEEDFDALTNYEMMCKIVAKLNEVVNMTNQQSEAIQNIIDWLENLDVQGYVDNKLDEMAESGELTEIIAQYLQLSGILAFNTINDLKNAENLIDGSFVETFGRTTYNDGLGSKYKIRPLVITDVIDDLNIISLSNYPSLVAERVEETIILPFNTLEELKEAENLIDGSFAQTYGKNTYNDGLGSKYKIRELEESDVIDENILVELTNYPSLVAEKIIEDIILPFNTLNDLKEADNLNNGSFVETYGKNTYNDGLGSKYKIRELEVSDVIDEYNLIALTNYPTLVAERIEEIKFKILSYDNIDFYVDGVNGDDLNNGDSTHPFKTFNRFLEEFKNYAEIRCHFIGTANEYTMNSIETFNSIGMHLINDSENANITINFLGRYTPAFYNSHLNVTGDSSHYFTLNIPNKLYFDGGYTLCSYTKFTGNTLTLNGGSADFNNVEFNYPLFVNKSITNVNYCTFVNSYLESNNSQIYVRGIIFNGNITSNPLRITWNSYLDLRTSCTLNGTITNEFIYAEDSTIISSCTLTNNSPSTVNGLYIRNTTLCMNNSRYNSFNIGTIYKQHSRLLAETYQYLN